MGKKYNSTQKNKSAIQIETKLEDLDDSQSKIMTPNKTD
jgi:hypothetical protein